MIPCNAEGNLRSAPPPRLDISSCRYSLLLLLPSGITRQPRTYTTCSRPLRGFALLVFLLDAAPIRFLSELANGERIGMDGVKMDAIRRRRCGSPSHRIRSVDMRMSAEQCRKMCNGTHVLIVQETEVTSHPRRAREQRCGSNPFAFETLFHELYPVSALGPSRSPEEMPQTHRRACGTWVCISGA